AAANLPLQRYIDPLRAKYPSARSEGTALTPTPRNVVDGLALWRDRASSPFAGLKPPPTANEIAAMTAELGRITRALDAVADLLVAESVHQMISGSTTGSGASLEALAEGKRPPEPEIAVAPR